MTDSEISVLAQMAEKYIVKCEQMLIAIEHIGITEPEMIFSVQESKQRIKTYNRRLNEKINSRGGNRRGNSDE